MLGDWGTLDANVGEGEGGRGGNLELSVGEGGTGSGLPFVESEAECD